MSARDKYYYKQIIELKGPRWKGWRSWPGVSELWSKFMTFSHQVSGIREHCAPAKGEQSLLHSHAPRSSWLRGKPCLYPPGGWLLGRVVHPWQLMRIRINSWGKWQLKYKSELDVLNVISLSDWKPKYVLFQVQKLQYISFAVYLSHLQTPPSLYLFCN